MRRPDFFIVGAPKCGTTTLWEVLRSHPDVFMPGSKKEPHFFGTDLEAPYFVRDEGEYLDLFADAGDATRAGEASPWYLYSRVAAGEIAAFRPDARIILTLRNPVDMMFSLHSQRLYNGGEDIVDFGEALAAEDDRRMGRRIPDSPIGPKEGLLYRDVAAYSGQLQRYLAAFGPDAVHVMVFEDLRTDAAAVTRKVFSFLGVDANFTLQVPQTNPNKRARSKLIRQWLQTAPTIGGRRIGSRFLPQTVRRRIRAWVQRMNTRHEARAPMDPQLRKRLLEEFRPEVARVSEMIGRDLSDLWGR